MKLAPTLLLTLALAGMAPAKDDDALASLKAAYDAKAAAALRPVRGWYAEELKKLEIAATKRGDLAAALAAKTKRTGLLLGSVRWVWDAGKAGKHEIHFREDGTGTHTYRGEVFKWTADGDTITLTYADGRKAKLQFDFVALSYAGTDFAGNGVKGKPASESL